MMDEMIKKTRSDHRADARHENTSSDTYSGVQLKNFLVNLDVPDSVNYEIAPRGCQTCLLRSFGQMVGEAWENSRLDPSMFPACQPSAFANSLQPTTRPTGPAPQKSLTTSSLSTRIMVQRRTGRNARRTWTQGHKGCPGII